MHGALVGLAGVLRPVDGAAQVVLRGEQALLRRRPCQPGAKPRLRRREPVGDRVALDRGHPRPVELGAQDREPARLLLAARDEHDALADQRGELLVEIGDRHQLLGELGLDGLGVLEPGRGAPQHGRRLPQRSGVAGQSCLGKQRPGRVVELDRSGTCEPRLHRRDLGRGRSHLGEHRSESLRPLGGEAGRVELRDRWGLAQEARSHHLRGTPGLARTHPRQHRLVRRRRDLACNLGRALGLEGEPGLLAQDVLEQVEPRAPHVVGRVGELLDVEGVVAARLTQRSQGVAHPGVGAADLLVRLATQLGEHLLDGLVVVGGEQAREHLATVVGVGAQERRELPLRQHHHLPELLGRQVAEQAAHLVVGLAHAGGEQHVLTRLEPPQPHRRLHGGGAGPVALGAGEGGGAPDAVPHAADAELQLDERLVRAREVRVQPLLARRPAGDRAVQREGDRVEHRRLAGAGGALEQEQPARRDGVEVEVVRRGERSERPQLQAVQPHATPAAVWGPARSAATDAAAGSACKGSPRRRASSSAVASTVISSSVGSPPAT